MEHGRLDELVAQLGDEDGGARRRARETLAAIGETAIPPLVGLLGSPDDRLRWEAAKALTELPDPSAIPGLVALLADHKSEIRWLAAVGLIHMGSRSVPPVLQALTENAASKGLRNSAHHIFHDLSERNGVLRDVLEPVVSVLGDIDPVEVVASRAETALRDLRALGGD